MTPSPFQGSDYTGCSYGAVGIGLPEAVFPQVQLQPSTPAGNEAITCRFAHLCAHLCMVAFNIQGWISLWLFTGESLVHDVNDSGSWWWMIVLQVFRWVAEGLAMLNCWNNVMVDHHCHGWSSSSKKYFYDFFFFRFCMNGWCFWNVLYSLVFGIYLKYF